MQQLSSGRVEPKPLEFEQVTGAAATTPLPPKSHQDLPQSSSFHHPSTNGQCSSTTHPNQTFEPARGSMTASGAATAALAVNNNLSLHNGMHNAVSANCNVCNESSNRLLIDQQLHLQCGFCAGACNLDTVELNVHELHALVSPTRNPGLVWKCNNCQQQPIVANIEHQLQLMSRQLLTLTAKVDAIANASNHNTFSLHDTSRAEAAATCRANYANSTTQWSFISAADTENSGVGYSQRPPQPMNSALNSTVLGSIKSRALRPLNVDFTPITDKTCSTYPSGFNPVAQKTLACRRQNTMGTPDSVFSESVEPAEHGTIDDQNQIQIYMDSGKRLVYFTLSIQFVSFKLDVCIHSFDRRRTMQSTIYE